MSDYNVIVIGGGPGGYVAAIRAAQNGLKTALVDATTGKDGKASLGGTCLNVGCIPSKALLESSQEYYDALHSFETHGISTGKVSIDPAKMVARKDDIVKKQTGGIGLLLKARKIDTFHGRGTIKAERNVEIALADGTSKTITGDNIVIATGSVAVAIPNIEVDQKMILDNAGALDITEVPKTLAIIGAGVIGLEMGSVWKRLGSEVVILEAMDTFLAPADALVQRDAARIFKKQGLDIHLGARVESAKVSGKKVAITYSDKNGEQSLKADKLIVAVGRRPNTEGLLSDESGVELTDRGFIKVDDHCATTAPNIWAIGDVVGGAMLAHKASEEGIAVMDRIAGKVAHMDYDTIPWVIYTHPEIAWVGKTEQQLKEEGVEIAVGKFPFAANGRAATMLQTDGFVKIIADKNTDRILGVHMIGPCVSEMIHEAVLAMVYKASAQDLALTIHAHPTLSEAVHEAALAVSKEAIHQA